MARLCTFAACALFGVATTANAQPVIVADSGDSAWMLTVFILAFFSAISGLGLQYTGRAVTESGLERNLGVVAIVSLFWAIAGYSLVFGTGTIWLGGLGNIGLSNLAELREDATVSEPVFALFQLAPAIFAAVLLASAAGEKARPGWLVGFAALWSVLVYVPIARALQGGGWLAQQGALDFAGGVTVHIAAGVAALIVAILRGKRDAATPNLRPLDPVPFGTGLVWIGVLALIGGSALAAGSDTAVAVLNAHLAACAGLLAWTMVRRVSTATAGLTAAHGAIAGLAAISAGAAYVAPAGAMLLGLVAGVASCVTASIVSRWLRIAGGGIVFAVHGIGGLAGALAFPFFVLPVFGGPDFDDGVTLAGQVTVQAMAVGTTIFWTAGVTMVAALMVAMIVPMSASGD